MSNTVVDNPKQPVAIPDFVSQIDSGKHSTKSSETQKVYQHHSTIISPIITRYLFADKDIGEEAREKGR